MEPLNRRVKNDDRGDFFAHTQHLARTFPLQGMRQICVQQLMIYSCKPLFPRSREEIFHQNKHIIYLRRALAAQHYFNTFAISPSHA
jgi:hypothetical protein